MLQRLNVASDWQRMWNNEVLPYLQAAKVVAGRGIRVDEHPGGTTISAVPAEQPSGGGAASPAKLAAVVTMPTSGGGMGTATPVMLGSGGEITTVSGGAISVKFPYLDGYN